MAFATCLRGSRQPPGRARAGVFSSLPLALLSIAAFASGMDSERELKVVLKKEERSYRALQHARDQLVSPYDRIPDFRGKTLGDDLRQNVLTADVSSRIEARFQSAKDALRRKDLQAARTTLDNLAQDLASQANTYRAIRQYWHKWGSHPPDRAAYWDNLARNGIPRAHPGQIRATEARFLEQIAAAAFFDAMSRSYPALLALYKQAAEEESAAIRTAIEEHRFVPLLEKEGPKVCRNPVPATSGSADPRPYKFDRSLDPYPVVSKRIGEEGIVRTYVLVSEAGCVTNAMLIVSSGYPRLDAATLEFVTRGRFNPAEQAGHASAKGMQYSMRFELTDWDPALELK